MLKRHSGQLVAQPVPLSDRTEKFFGDWTEAPASFAAAEICTARVGRGW
jgi:hypothetical protein